MPIFRLVLVYFLSFLLIYQPFESYASNAGAGLVVDPKAPVAFQPRITASERGVPVVDITSPSAGGVSRNQYSDFNVGEQGLVLNNSREQTVTVTGGRVNGNYSLETPADVILNEVTSGNSSTLRGTTEVAGKSAKVMVANPNGISCNGCGFMNTPQVNLTTGTPQFDGAGNLSGVSVGQGAVTVEGSGLRALTADEVHLSGKTVRLDGRVRVNPRGELVVSSGTHQVGADGNVTAGNGSAGGVWGIDGTVVGAAEAGKITLMSTDAGAGVKMNGRMAATAGDITITADGKIRLGKPRGNAQGGDYRPSSITTYGALTVKSNTEVEKNANSYSFDDTTIEGRTVSNTGRVESDHGIAIHAHKGDFTNSGKLDAGEDVLLRVVNGTMVNSGQVDAGNDLNIQATYGIKNTGVKLVAVGHVDIRTSGDLVNDNADIYALNGIDVKAANMTHSSLSYLGSDGALSIAVVDQLLNQNSRIQSLGKLTLSGDQLINDGGEIVGNADMLLTFRDLYNKAGLIAQTGSGFLDIRATGDLINVADGRIEGKSGIRIEAGHVYNYAGTIASENGLQIAAEDIDNRTGLLSSNGRMKLEASRHLINDAGVINAGGDAELTAQNLWNNQGSIRANGNLTMTADQLQGIAGEMIAGNNLDARVTGRMDVRGSVLEAGKDMYLEGLQIAADQAALQASEKLTAKALGTDGMLPAFSAQDALILAGLADNNAVLSLGTVDLESNGSFIADGAVVQATDRADITAAQDVTFALGQIVTPNGVTISAGRDVFAPFALIASDNEVRVNAGGLATFAGNGAVGALISKTNLFINAGSLYSDGTLFHASDLIDIAANNGGIDGQFSTLIADVIHINALNHITNTNSLWQAGTELALITMRDNGTVSDLSGSRFEAPSIAFDVAGGLDISRALTGVSIDALGLHMLSDRLEVLAGNLTANQAALASNNALNINARTGFLHANDAFLHANAGLYARANSDTTLDRSQITAGSDAGLSADTSLAITSGSGISIADTNIAANDKVTLDAGNGALSGVGSGVISMSDANASMDLAGGSITMTGDRFETQHDLNITTRSGDALFGGDVIVHGNLTANTAGSLINQGGNMLVLGSLSGNIQGNLENNNSATLAIQNAVNWALGGSLLNTNGSIITTPSDITVSAVNIQNTNGSRMETAGAMNLTGNGTITNSGSSLYAGGGNLALNGGSFINQGGVVQSANNVIASLANDLSNSNNGRIVASNGITLTATNGTLDNQTGGWIQSGVGDVALRASNIENKLGGTVISGRDVTLTATHDDSSGNNLSNGDGSLVQASGDITIVSAGRIGNSDESTGVGGTYRAGGDITGTAGSVTHNLGGTFEAGGDITLTSQSGIKNDGGNITAAGDVTLTGGTRTGNYWHYILDETTTDGTRYYSMTGIGNNGGEIVAGGNLSLTAPHLNNTDGTLSGTNVLITTQNNEATVPMGVLNTNGEIIGARGVTLTSNDTVYNENGLISTHQGTTSITVLTALSVKGDLKNTGGVIEGTNVNIVANVDNSLGIANVQGLAALLAQNPGLAALLGLNPSQVGGLTAADIAKAGLILHENGSITGVNGEPLEDVLRSGLAAKGYAVESDAFRGERVGVKDGSRQFAIVALPAAQRNGTTPQISAHPELLTLTSPADQQSIEGLASLIRSALQIKDPSTTAGTIRASNNIDIDGALDNRGGIVDAGNVLSLNHSETILNDAIILADGRIVKGSMQANHIVIADGGKVSNKGGKMVASGILSIEADSLLNERIQQSDGTWTGGKLKGDQVFTVLNGDLLNKGGIIENNTSIYLEANNIRNESIFDAEGRMLSQALINGNNVTLIANEALINFAGKIKAKGTLYAEAGYIVNESYVVTDILTQSHDYVARDSGGNLITSYDTSGRLLPRGSRLSETTTTATSRVTGLGVMKGGDDTILIATKGDIYNRGNITAGGALITNAKRSIINEVITGQEGTITQTTRSQNYRGQGTSSSGHIGTVSLGGGLMQGATVSMEAGDTILNRGGWINATTGLASIQAQTIRNEAIVDTWEETVQNPEGRGAVARLTKHYQNLYGSIYGDNMPGYLQPTTGTVSMPMSNLVAMGHITGNQVMVNASGDVTNQGTIAGENGTFVHGQNVYNDTIRLTAYDADALMSQANPHRPQNTNTLGGIFNTAAPNSGIIGNGGDTTILADQTIFNYGQMQAKDTLTLAASQVISNAQTGTETRYLADGTPREFNEVYAGTGLLTGTNVQVSGTEGITINGGTVLATGDATLYSEKGDVTIAGAKRTWTDQYNNRPFEYLGGEVMAGGSTTISAGNQVILSAADVGAYDDVTISGTNGIISTAQGESFVTIEKKHSHHEHALITPTTITSAAGNVNLISNNGSITMIGTQINAGALATSEDKGKINAYAKGDITMDALAVEELNWRTKQNSAGLIVAVVAAVASCVVGCVAAGALATMGSVMTAGIATGTAASVVAAGAIGVAAGSVVDGGVLAEKVTTEWNDHNVALTTMNAANGINIYAEGEVKGKGVLFGTRNGDIVAFGKEGTTFDSEQVTKYIKQHGWRLTGNASILGGLVNTNNVGAALHGDADGAMQATISGNQTLNVLNNLKHVDGDVGALNAVNLASHGYDIYKTGSVLQANGMTGNGGMGAVNVSVNLSSVNNEQRWTESYLSQFNANNGNVIIGSGKDVNLLGGTQISAGKNIILNAGRDLNITANKDVLTYRDSSSGVGVGVGSGISVSAYNNKAKTDGTTYTNSSLKAGGDIITTSGRDTNIAGANLLAGGMLDMDVGRNLSIASLQNATVSENSGMSAGVTFGAGGATSASVGGGTSGSADRLFTDNQTTLIGQEGVRVHVNGHTQIDGAVIANVTKEGVDGGNLVLDTGTLGFSDLADNDDYHQTRVNLSTAPDDKRANGASTNGTSVNVAIQRQDVDGVTRATVGKGIIIVRNGDEQEQNPLLLNRDINNTQEVMKSFNSQGEMTIKVPQQIIDAISSGDEQQVNQVVGDLSEEDRAELLAAALAKEVAGYEYTEQDEKAAAGLVEKAKQDYGIDVTTLSFEEKRTYLNQIYMESEKVNGQIILTDEQRNLRDAIYTTTVHHPDYIEFRESVVNGFIAELKKTEAVQQAAKHWQSMDESSKQTFIENVIDLEQSIGGSNVYVPVIMVKKGDQPGLNGLYSPAEKPFVLGDKTVYLRAISINTLSSKHNDFYRTLQTSVHEGWHAYQYFLVTNPSVSKNYGIDPQTDMLYKSWALDGSGGNTPYYLYRSNPLESDAWYVGGLVKSGVQK